MHLITKSKKDLSLEGQRLEKEAIDYLGLNPDIKIDLYDMYSFESISEDEFNQIKSKIFDDKHYLIFENLDHLDKDYTFRYRQVTGQYNEKEFMVGHMIRNILGYIEARVYHSRIISFENISKEEVDRFKDYYINPVEKTIIPMDQKNPDYYESDKSDLNHIEGFIDMDEGELEDLSLNFSMDLEDLSFCQEYFKEEGRNPNTTELKVIDTYWSDHCRHTTFNSHIEQIDIDQGPYKDLFQKALDLYMEKRRILARDKKPLSLMDMGTIQAKYLREKGLLDNVEISAEINACALEIKVDNDGKDEDWILYFKNETHNHPTEIEPFGGASTCVGGGIRDPLSGRSWVYQLMRISGAKDPRMAFDEKHRDKLAQRTICQEALKGSSDYSNKAGVNGGFAEELYHPGFEAKRLEAGAFLAAAPRENIIREEPVEGDRIILLGGKTARDGIGAALGSSQALSGEDLDDLGAEVQKGAPSVQRKIMRLFRNPLASKLIKRSNDFGAGGVAVAIGEIADGIDIDLDKVPLKYPGLHGGEIALSESQERMAVVIAEKDVDEFLQYAKEEDVEASIIARVSSNKRMTMTWQDNIIIDLSREFLDSNGCQKYARARLVQEKEAFKNSLDHMDISQESLEEYMSDLNRADQKSMAQKFDGSIGRSSLLYSYGGKYRDTKELGMVSKLPVDQGKTSTSSGMAYGYNPHLADQSPFHGAYYAVIESVSRMVAMGFDYRHIRLSFQEYFESLKDDPQKWGKAVSALLGANLAMDGLGLGSIGGKDSMSGTYEDLNVAPSLISFAIGHGNKDYLISRPFKAYNSKIILVENPLKDDKTIDLDLELKIYQRIHDLAKDNKILAATTVSLDGMLKDIIEMQYGNRITANIYTGERIGQPMLGSFILEISEKEDPAELLKDISYEIIGQTNSSASESFTIGPVKLDLSAIHNASKSVLDPIYYRSRQDQGEIIAGRKMNYVWKKEVAKPKALIALILGSIGEYDLEAALKDEKFDTESFIIKDSSNYVFQESIKKFIDKLEESDLLALPSGAVFADQPNPGKAWELILTRRDVKEAIHRHLDRKNLILGTGSSFASLINTGLIEYGEIRGQSNIKLVENDNCKFISDIYQGSIISNNSAFSSTSYGLDYTGPLASRFSKVDLGPVEKEMRESGRIISIFNNYHSEYNIDGLCCPKGLVFGTLSSFERVSEDLYQNIGNIRKAPFLKDAYRYFKGSSQ